MNRESERREKERRTKEKKLKRKEKKKKKRKEEHYHQQKRNTKRTKRIERDKEKEFVSWFTMKWSFLKDIDNRDPLESFIRTDLFPLFTDKTKEIRLIEVWRIDFDQPATDKISSTKYIEDSKKQILVKSEKKEKSWRFTHLATSLFQEEKQYLIQFQVQLLQSFVSLLFSLEGGVQEKGNDWPFAFLTFLPQTSDHPSCS